jgi:hypothetical protein
MQSAAMLAPAVRCNILASCKFQARLVLGVRAEMDACKEALLRLYRRCPSL